MVAVEVEAAEEATIKAASENPDRRLRAEDHQCVVLRLGEKLTPTFPEVVAVPGLMVAADLPQDLNLLLAHPLAESDLQADLSRPLAHQQHRDLRQEICPEPFLRNDQGLPINQKIALRAVQCLHAHDLPEEDISERLALLLRAAVDPRQGESTDGDLTQALNHALALRLDGEVVVMAQDVEDLLHMLAITKTKGLTLSGVVPIAMLIG